ncbi:hypothetical protein DVH05_009449 [Phytophthora capsici]|nr:hypothetical protein DVH05_009449 [Phytophthora capsici]
MQMITGDHYPNCEPDLAKWCCKCENDNLTIFGHLCRECKYSSNFYSRWMTKENAQKFYGVKDFSGINEESTYVNCNYDICVLENYMLRVCGSKMAWLREVARQHVKREEAYRRKEERKSVIAQLDPDFKEYIHLLKLSRSGKCARYTDLEKCQTKFKELKEVLTERGLPPRPDFYNCKRFIMTKSGNLDQVVDNMEEKHFLFTQTEYQRLSGDSINADRRWFVRETYQVNEVVKKNIKAGLCVQYLQDNKGVTIPQKWEKCRQRFDEIVSENLDPKVRALYIYSGEAPPEADHLETR